MGIDDSIPISTELAPSWSKKLVSNTPPVMLVKIVAKMPSIVEALRLVLTACVEIICCDSGDCTDADAPGGSSIFEGGADKLSTRAKSNVKLNLGTDE